MPRSLAIGPLSLLLPVLVLLGLVIWDSVFGLRTGGGDFEVIPLRPPSGERPAPRVGTGNSKHTA